MSAAIDRWTARLARLVLTAAVRRRLRQWQRDAWRAP